MCLKMGPLLGLEGRLAGASETCLSPPPQCRNYKVMAWCPDFSAKSKTPDRLHWSKLKERVNGNFYLFLLGMLKTTESQRARVRQVTCATASQPGAIPYPRLPGPNHAGKKRLSKKNKLVALQVSWSPAVNAFSSVAWSWKPC